jgi:murein DD-endopeptidase MepM/ murein hydrolase activator NlpD
MSLINILMLFLLISETNYIDLYKDGWKQFYNNKTSKEAVDKWFLPFDVPDRSNFKQFKIISTFGSPRQSYKKGHIHTGIDMIPAKKNGFVYVYPMAKGVVCSIHLGHPHKTIVISHKLQDGSIIFTSYKHLQEIYIQNGEQVNPNTKIARLYTKEEAKKQGGNYDHLHFEVRKKFDDYGCASWYTMTKKELNEYFYEPVEFIKKHL